MMRLQTLRHERGASAVEYGLLVAAIAAVIVVVVMAVGTVTGNLFDKSCDSVSAATPEDDACAP